MTTVYDATKAQYGPTVPKQIYWAPANGAKLVGVYHSGDIAERVSTIPLGKTACMLQVLVPDPRPNDMIVAHADGEITSDRLANTAVDGQLWWVNASGCSAEDSHLLGVFSGNNGMNVTPDIHHLKIANLGSYIVPSNTPSGALRYVSWVVHCAASNTTAQPTYIKVEPGCSVLSVRHYRPL